MATGAKQALPTVRHQMQEVLREDEVLLEAEAVLLLEEVAVHAYQA